VEQRKRRRWSVRLLLILIPFLGVSLWYASFAVSYVANHRVFFVPSASMSPAIAPGDRITVDRGAGSPGRGEVWAFSMPDGTTLVKRIIGLPGETVEVSGGRVLIDGKPISEPYLTTPMNYAMPPVSLGPDEYFVLGDNRNASNDSHIWGPIGKSRFLGRAELRYRPGGGISGLK
jgi:signal peptidase I